MYLITLWVGFRIYPLPPPLPPQACPRRGPPEDKSSVESKPLPEKMSINLEEVFGDPSGSLPASRGNSLLS